MRQFLRGQGVPIHEREETPIIVMTAQGKEMAVAVKVNEKWLVHADYDHFLQVEAGNNSAVSYLDIEVANA
jgi:hypothetical protein